jgi:hypothetical protein
VVATPPKYPLTEDKLFKRREDGRVTPDMKLIRQHLIIEGQIHKELLNRILLEVT